MAGGGGAARGGSFDGGAAGGGDDFFSRDFFAVFDLARKFDVDEADLAGRYRALQRRAHPDRHAGRPEAERRLALSMASRINDAYAALKKPLSRAAYLLSLHGVDAFAETDTNMPADFLERQMEWREALAEADAAKKQSLRADIVKARDETMAATAAALHAGAWDDAADAVRRWRYWEKLLEAAA